MREEDAARGPALAVAVPCWNEAARLRGDVFARTLAAHPDWRFVFVDDGSSDGTGEALEALARRDPERIAVLRLPRNRGKAEAVRQGVLAAAAGGAPHVAFLDADLSTGPEDLAALLAEAGRSGALVVCGSRVRLLGRRIERRAVRHYLGRVFATAASLTLGLPVYDTQCGAKLFRNGPDLAAVFGRPFNSTWTFDVELLGRYLLRLGGVNALPGGLCAIVEHPLAAWADVAGSKVRPRHFFTGLFELLRIRRLLRSRTYRTLFGPDR